MHSRTNQLVQLAVGGTINKDEPPAPERHCVASGSDHNEESALNLPTRLAGKERCEQPYLTSDDPTGSDHEKTPAMPMNAHHVSHTSGLCAVDGAPRNGTAQDLLPSLADEGRCDEPHLSCDEPADSDHEKALAGTPTDADQVSHATSGLCVTTGRARDEKGPTQRLQNRLADEAVRCADGSFPTIDDAPKKSNYLPCDEPVNRLNYSSDDLESLFSGDVSDSDPTYRPIQSPSSSSSLDEDDIVISDIMNLLLDQVCKSKQTPKRWREADPNNWKINVAKKRRTEGLSYITRNKIRSAKVPQNINCDNCMYKCTQHFNQEERNALCRYYWSLDFRSKKNYLLSNLKVKPPKRVLSGNYKRNPRAYSMKCFFSKGIENQAVCQSFMCKTLCISQDVLRQAVKNKNELGLYTETDKRGCKEPPNKTKPDIIKHVKTHIESFPCMEPHYIRKESKRKYLDMSLSINKMYGLYLESAKENNISEPVSAITYRRIFSKHYNFGFFVPKKDQCLICTNFAKASPDKKKDLEENYQEHIQRKIKCNDEKEKDKERATKQNNFMSLTFDLQAVLQIPSCPVGLLYYSRKLCVYNLTLYEAPLPNRAFCFAWSEVNGKKGSCEIGSILYYYLTNYLPDHISEISLFSDTCGGQNRNQFVSSLLLWAVQKIDHLQIIEQKFLESGHTYMEADSMHSSIESAKKHATIYSMPDWLSIFRQARSKKTRIVEKKKVTVEPYVVKEFKYHEFFDLKDLADSLSIGKAKDNHGNKVKWLKIKRIKYVKGESDTIYFNYDMSDNFLFMTVGLKNTSNQNTPHNYLIRKRRNKSDVSSPAQQASTDAVACTFPTELKKLYGNPLPINAAKKNDLVKLCKKGIIPEELHGWFNELSASSTVVDRVPLPSVDEASEEE